MSQEKVMTLSEMAIEMCDLFTSLNEDEVNHILKMFVRYVKKELLNGNEVVIDKIGTFKNKSRPPRMATTIYGERRQKPRTEEPYFEPHKKLRRYINKAKYTI